MPQFSLTSTTTKNQLRQIKKQFENPATGVTHRYWFENPNVGMPVREDGGGGGAGGRGDSRLMPRECREMVKNNISFHLLLSSSFQSRASPPRRFLLTHSLDSQKKKNREPRTRPPSPSTSAGRRPRPARRSRPLPPPRPRPRPSRSTASPAGWAPCPSWSSPGPATCAT